MKQVKHKVLICLGIIYLAIASLRAQGCPSPENLNIQILPGPPPIAHVTWDVPAGGNVVGFIFTYTIDGVSTTINLPLSPTEYWVPLPENWSAMTVSLVSLCADGSTSDPATSKVGSIIIEDLVMFQPGGAAEYNVCVAPCGNSTYFYYSVSAGLGGSGLSDPPSQGSAELEEGTNGAAAGSVFMLFRNTTFCGCMRDNNNDFQNEEVLNTCRDLAKEIVVLQPYMSFCQRPRTRGKSFQPTAGQTFWYPNPVSDMLQIEPGTQGKKCAITDLAGREVWASMDVSAGSSVPVQHWLPGVYLIKIQTAEGTQIQGKIVKI